MIFDISKLIDESLSPTYKKLNEIINMDIYYSKERIISMVNDENTTHESLRNVLISNFYKIIEDFDYYFGLLDNDLFRNTFISLIDNENKFSVLRKMSEIYMKSKQVNPKFNNIHLLNIINYISEKDNIRMRSQSEIKLDDDQWNYLVSIFYGSNNFIETIRNTFGDIINNDTFEYLIQQKYNNNVINITNELMMIAYRTNDVYYFDLLSHIMDTETRNNIRSMLLTINSFESLNGYRNAYGYILSKCRRASEIANN